MSAASCSSCPPEDTGEAHGYAQFLAALADPRHEEHEQYLTWIGGRFDLSRFDLTAITTSSARSKSKSVNARRPDAYSRTVKRVARSTSVPIEELASPRMRSPSQWPGIARSSTTAGRSLIRISEVTNDLPRRADHSLGTRNVRPVRKQAVSSRRRAPRPCMYSDW